MIVPAEKLCPRTRTERSPMPGRHFRGGRAVRKTMITEVGTTAECGMNCDVKACQGRLVPALRPGRDVE